VAYTWTPPSLFPGLLPWIGILALLMLGPNRGGSAWWIWAPLGLLIGLTTLSVEGMGAFAEFTNAMREPVLALAFGLATVWLLMPYISMRNRFVSFLAFLLVLGVAGGATLAIRLLAEGVSMEALPGAMILAVMAPLIALGVGLAGVICRRRYRPGIFTAWLLGLLLAGAILIVTPFFAVAYFSSGGNVPLTALVASISGLAGGGFALVLPFLLLAFANEFYRNRLKDLLKMGGGETPPLLVPTPATGEWVAK
jgi:hypothetical protein